MFSISFYLRRPFIFLGLLYLSFYFILLQDSCFALTYFQVETLKGESLYNQKTRKKNDSLKEDGLLKVSKKSFLGVSRVFKDHFHDFLTSSDFLKFLNF